MRFVDILCKQCNRCIGMLQIVDDPSGIFSNTTMITAIERHSDFEKWKVKILCFDCAGKELEEETK